MKFHKHSLNYQIQIFQNTLSFCATFMTNEEKIKPSVITIDWKFRKPSEIRNTIFTKEQPQENIKNFFVLSAVKR